VNKLFAISNPLHFLGEERSLFLDLFSNIGGLVITKVIFVAQYISKKYAWVEADRKFCVKSSGKI
jgi:hypothetical protein